MVTIYRGGIRTPFNPLGSFVDLKPGEVLFSSSIPQTTKKILTPGVYQFTLVGSGGGGGGGYNYHSKYWGGGGGGSGSAIIGIFTLLESIEAEITVGKGGDGAVGHAAGGRNGEDSLVVLGDSSITGGHGGGGGAGPRGGGGGGTSSYVGDFTITSNIHGNGGRIGLKGWNAGPGGNSVYNGYGAGGKGAINNERGTDGEDGFVEIQYLRKW